MTLQISPSAVSVFVFLNELKCEWHIFQGFDAEDGEQSQVDSGTHEDVKPVNSVVRSVWEMMVHTSAFMFNFSYWALFCVLRKSLRLQNTAGKNSDIYGKQKDLEYQDVLGEKVLEFQTFFTKVIKNNVADVDGKYYMIHPVCFHI